MKHPPENSKIALSKEPFRLRNLLPPSCCPTNNSKNLPIKCLMITYDHCVRQAGGFQKTYGSGARGLGFLKLWNCHLSRCVAALPPESKPWTAGNIKREIKQKQQAKALRLLGPLLIMSSLAMSQLNESRKTTLQVCSANHCTALFFICFLGLPTFGELLLHSHFLADWMHIESWEIPNCRSSRPEIPRAARTSSAAASTCLNQRPCTMDLPEKTTAGWQHTL